MSQEAIGTKLGLKCKKHCGSAEELQFESQLKQIRDSHQDESVVREK